MSREARALPPGAIVRLEDSAGGALGTATFNPRPLISARVLSRDPDAVRSTGSSSPPGSPGALASCAKRLFDAPYYRLAWSEADGLPGLVLDRHGDAAWRRSSTPPAWTASPTPLTEAMFAAVGSAIPSSSATTPPRARSKDCRRDTSLAGAPGGFSGRDRGERGAVPGRSRRSGPEDRLVLRPPREPRPGGGAGARHRTCWTPTAISAASGFRPPRPAPARCSAWTGRSLRSRSAPGRRRAQRLAGLRATFLRGDVFDTLEAFARDGRELRHRGLRPAGFRQIEEGSGERAQGLPQADPPRGGLRAPGRLPVRRVVLAPCRRRAVRRGRARRAADSLRRGGRLLHRGGAGPDHPIHPFCPRAPI